MLAHVFILLWLIFAYIQCGSDEDDRIADFELKLMQIESEHMEIPEQQYKVVARVGWAPDRGLPDMQV